jgi:hypothetical protein
VPTNAVVNLNSVKTAPTIGDYLRFLGGFLLKPIVAAIKAALRRFRGAVTKARDDSWRERMDRWILSIAIDLALWALKKIGVDVRSIVTDVGRWIAKEVDGIAKEIDGKKARRQAGGGDHG